WLYGCNGIQSQSLVAAPGTPREKRTALDCGVWRYHPTRRTFELVASGTTNPWGLDWNEHGELFIPNSVIKPLFHAVPGLHGNRLNRDRLERSRSGYVARHCEDFLFGNDDWFRPLWMHMAADGGVFLGDWHDTGECHNYDKTHPSGRVYHITFGKPGRTVSDLASADDAALVALQTHRNDWYARVSRRLLQERAAAKKLGKKVQ